MRLLHSSMALGYKAKNTAEIVDFADLHFFDTGCDKQLLRENIKAALGRQFRRLISTGDLFGASWTKRMARDSMAEGRENEFAGDMVDMLRAVEEDFLPLLWPVSDKFLFMIAGNHWEKIKLRAYPLAEPRSYTKAELGEQIHRGGEESHVVMSSTEYICRRLGVPFGGHGEVDYILSLRTEKPSRVGAAVIINARHTCGKATTFAGDYNNLAKHMPLSAADIYIGSHTHKNYSVPFTRKFIDVRTHSRTFRPGLLIRTGTALNGRVEGRADYSEMRDYPLTTPRWSVIKILTHCMDSRGMFIEDIDAISTKFDQVG